jgi:hypothetical protein
MIYPLHGELDSSPVSYGLFFYTNNTSLKKKRITHFINENYVKTKKNVPVVYVFQDASDDGIFVKKYAEYLGLPNSCVYNVETLPKPPTVPRPEKTTTSVQEIYKTDVSQSGYSYWGKSSIDTVDPTKTYYYVDFFYSEPSWQGKTIDDDTLVNAVSILLESKKLASNVILYGINKKNSYVLKVGTWINVMDMAKTHVEKHAEKYSHLLYKVQQKSTITLYSRIKDMVSDNLVTGIKNKETKKMFVDFITHYQEISRLSTNTALLQLFGVKAKKPNDGFDFEQFHKMIVSKYFDMFSCFERYTVKNAVVCNIINFIDEKS